MNFIREIISKIPGNLTDSARISIACISTTNPVYLIFESSSAKPEYVIRLADNPSAAHAHTINQTLFEMAAHLVPEPVALIEHEGAKYSIQRGVSGSPWFQIAKNYSSKHEWAILRSRALAALANLHATSERMKLDDEKVFNPLDNLISAFNRFINLTSQDTGKMHRFFEKSCNILTSSNTTKGTIQHGDFCLNNLIISDSHMTIIDFEDFGITQMPLYDEFTLSLSLAISAPSTAKTSISNELNKCVLENENSHFFSNDVIKSLFFYHLLLRLGDWSLGEKRQAYRQWLTKILNQFIDNPDHYLLEK